MPQQKVVVVGAGPVGALAAIYAAERGNIVEVYELRGDLRNPSTVPLNFTKSINLSLSERGINAMRHAGVADLLPSILQDTTPMHGRMIHSCKDGRLHEESQLYDVHGRFNRAADRSMLNKALLDSLERMPNVKIFFGHKLTGADFDRNMAWFEKRGTSDGDRAGSTTTTTTTTASSRSEVQVSFDLMLGCDGAHSAVRYHLMKFTRISYSQSYIDTLWCEFHIEASDERDHGFRISPNHLHIWPGTEFMFIAIPSTDKTFTCTLFAPAAVYADLDSHPERLIPFFDANFPGVTDRLIPEAKVREQYRRNPHLPLISIKASPHHFGSSGVILGDAAHAMVPFYGQGMNAGLEDVRILFETLDRHQKQQQHDLLLSRKSFPSSSSSASTRAAALAEYSKVRVPQAHAICDLAMRNYQEMRADVQSPLYLLRKTVEERLSLWFPALDWATQYSRVSFENLGYDEVVARGKRQGAVLGWVFAGVCGGFGALAVWGTVVLCRGLKGRR